MSSDEEDTHHKNHRKQNACDSCRKRKGDGHTMPENICTNCIALKSDCTHDIPTKKRGPKAAAYVKELEIRVKKLEEALLAYVPGIDLDALTNGTDTTRPIVPLTLRSPSPAANPTSESISLNSAQDYSFVVMDSEFVKLQKGRFFGPSSSYKYFKDAIKVKRGFISSEHPELERDLHSLKRAEYWGSKSYETANADRYTVKSLDFPPDDLLQDLIDIHFRNAHLTMPIIHEPKFRKNVQEGLHRRDVYFGRLVMMMCALSSRDSNDPRVLIQGEKECSAGWKYYEQVQVMRQWMFEAPSLHELQIYSLAIKYSFGTSAPQNTWVLITLGIRFCHELGIHRKRPPGYPVTIQEEERKRVFWHLVGVDRFMSSFVGRPSGYRDEDFDADLPAECDDECIAQNADSSVFFMQPIDKPSRMLYATCMGRLQDILSVALRALYSTTKSRMQMGLSGERWEQDVISELDSALNKWVDTIPDHLRWNKGQSDRTFIIQSASLHIMYNIVQIQIHRPLMNSSNQSDSNLSSIICTNSARSIAGVIGSQIARGDITIDQINLIGCFMAAVTLLMHMWINTQNSSSTSYQRDTGDVDKCKAYLEIAEKRWAAAGRFSDLINELSFAKEIPIPQSIRNGPRYSRPDPVASLHEADMPELADTSVNLWSTNYIPQYGVRQDFPLIPMQIPLSPGAFDYGREMDIDAAAGDFPMEGQSFWQMPTGFDMLEWDQYITRMTEEFNQNDSTSDFSMGTL